MKTGKDAMVDIETLGTCAGDVILCVGYLEFDPRGDDDFLSLLGNGRNHVYHIDREEQINKGYTVDEGTQEWWDKQGEDAQKRVLGADPNCTIVECMEKLQNLLSSVDNMWSYGYMDMAMLNYMSYRETGKELLFYRKHTDLRTVAKLMEFTWDKKPTGMVKHDPVHDCAYQALAVQKLMRE